MKASFWAAVALAVLISGAAAYGKEAAPAGAEPGVILRPVNRKSAEYLSSYNGKRLQAAEAKRAEEEEKLREQEKKAKMEKIQRKTGRTLLFLAGLEPVRDSVCAKSFPLMVFKFP